MIVVIFPCFLFFRPTVELYVTIKELKFGSWRTVMLTSQDSILLLFLFHSSNQGKASYFRMTESFSQHKAVLVLWIRNKWWNPMLYSSSCGPFAVVFPLWVHASENRVTFYFASWSFSNWPYLLPRISRQQKWLPKACFILSILVTKICNLAVEGEWFILSGKCHFSKWLSGHV